MEGYILYCRLSVVAYERIQRLSVVVYGRIHRLSVVAYRRLQLTVSYTVEGGSCVVVSARFKGDCNVEDGSLSDDCVVRT